jgi:2-phosphoglycerate kinase
MDPLERPGATSDRRRSVTVKDGKANLPYSKGLMATSMMAAGLPPSRAYYAAEVLERQLLEGPDAEVTADELRELAAAVLAEEVGPRYADNYRRWQRAKHRDVPLIVLLGGTTGVGKSTVATTVAGRLGIVRIVSTDAIREVMRGIFTKEMMPSLHTSSFDVASAIPVPLPDTDPVIAGFRLQVQAVSVGIAQLIRRAVVEGTDLIIEGAHVVPGYLAPPSPDEAIVARVVLTVEDEAVHRSHFIARSHDARARGGNRYLEQLGDIRRIQEYLRLLAREHGVPLVSGYSLDSAVARVMELVLAATTDAQTSATSREPLTMAASHDVQE